MMAATQSIEPDDWVFNANALQVEKRAAGWPDHELIGFLTHGRFYYSVGTPKISWFAPYSSSMFKQWTSFVESVKKEIGLK